jgi:hypothetical protein
MEKIEGFEYIKDFYVNKQYVIILNNEKWELHKAIQFFNNEQSLKAKGPLGLIKHLALPKRTTYE